MTWKKIDSAPKVMGTVIECRRELGDGTVIYEGLAQWRRQIFGDGHVATGWMHPEKPHKVPVPTHWRPQDRKR